MSTHSFLALDLGTRFGWAFGQNGGEKRYGSLLLPGANREQRLAHAMRQTLPYLIANSGAAVVVYEKPFVRGDAATRMLWGLAGVIEAVATTKGVPVLDATASQIRAHVFGTPKGLKKDDIIARLEERSYIFDMIPGDRKGETMKDHHAADALALLLYALDKVEIEL